MQHTMEEGPYILPNQVPAEAPMDQQETTTSSVSRKTTMV